MSKALPTMQKLAAEAEFQLQAAADQLNWLAALASAIQLDHTHGRGKYAAHLAELAGYLSDTDFSSVHSSIDEFKQLSESVPQITEVPNRGARGAGETLASRTAWAREFAGLSQHDLASLLSVKQATISYIESGRTKRSGYLPDIARACKVDVAWLAFGAEVCQ